MVVQVVDDETERKMSDLIKSQEGGISLDLLMTRMFGSKLYVDVEIERMRIRRLEIPMQLPRMFTMRLKLIFLKSNTAWFM